MLCSSFYCFSQSDARFILHVIDTSYHNNDESFMCNHKILIMNGKEYSEVLSIFNYSDNFYFVCSYFDSSDYVYFVFCNYGSSAGISKAYFVEPTSESIYESSALFEYDVPIYTSFTKGDLEFRTITFKKGECGTNTSKKVELYHCLKTIKTYTVLPKKFVESRKLFY